MQFIKTQVEPWVRSKLGERYGHRFESRSLRLDTGAKHEFDAVSEDGSIVISIKSASGLTSGGKLPQGKFHSAIAEVYYLSLVAAATKALLITNPQFFELLKKKLHGLLPAGLSMSLLQLPAEMQTELDQVIKAASIEVTPQAVAAAAEADVD